VADSLITHCEAYDLLEALPAAVKPSTASPADRLTRLAGDLKFWHWTVQPQRSNHGIRVSSGLGVAAICFNGLDVYRLLKPRTWRLRPRAWIDAAEDNLDVVGRGSD